MQGRVQQSATSDTVLFVISLLWDGLDQTNTHHNAATQGMVRRHTGESGEGRGKRERVGKKEREGEHKGERKSERAGVRGEERERESK